MVVMLRPVAAARGKEHDLTAWPSTCTVQAPQAAIPHPYFVPVRPSCSRITHSSGVSGSASTVACRPLMVREIMTSSCKAETGERQGELADALTRSGENGVADGGVHWDRTQ